MNQKRVLPEPQRYAVCSPDDISIKKFYNEYFEECFIFLHPFIKATTINPNLFCPQTYPNKTQIIENCEIVTWEEFLKLSNINDIKELDIGLRSSIHGLGKKYIREDLIKKIDIVCEEYNIISPTEGYFPELLINKILTAIKKERYNWLWRGDEFCTERKLEYINDIIDEDDIYRFNLFTNDNRILVAPHWDSHFSLLCSNKSIVENIVKFSDLEGFFCNNKTKIYWSLQVGD